MRLHITSITKTKYFVLLLIFTLPFSLFADQDINIYPGFFDLRKVDLASNNYELEGKWEFYWEELIEPGDFSDTPQYMLVPAQWDTVEGQKNWGYGTYRCTLLLTGKSEHIGLLIPFTFHHYRIYMDGELVAKNGTVYSERTFNANRSGSVVIDVRYKNEVEIVIQTSNFDDSYGGFISAPEIGLYEKLVQEKNRTIIFEAFLFGALFITGLIYLSFFINKLSGKSALFFGLFSIVLAIRTLIYGEHLMLMIFQFMSYEVENAIGHWTFYLAVPLFMKFASLAFPYKFSKIVNIPIYILSVAYLLFSAISQHRIYYPFLIYYQIVGLIGGFIALIVLVKYAINNNKAAQVTLVGFLILLLATINDVLLSQEIIATFDMVPIGMSAFIISQAILLSWQIGSAYSKSEELGKELTLANTSFRRFVPEEFLKFLNKDKISEIELGDNVQMEMTVMFCDIRDFTSLSEDLTPQENFLFLNSYLNRVGPVIREHNGFIDKYVGDGMMALFPDGPESAIQAAIKMQDALKLYNEHRESFDYKPIRIGIGINTGNLMLGTIGENERMDGTVISDAVNVCSRIESITKEYGLQIAIGEKSYKGLTNPFKYKLRAIGDIKLKGKRAPVQVYELFDNDPEKIIKLKYKYKNSFEKAVELYSNKQYASAKKIFFEILKAFPEDKTSLSYMKKIAQIAKGMNR